MDEAVERLLATPDPAVAGLARRLCALLTEHYPDAVVSAHREIIRFGSGTGYKGLVFTVAPYRRHVMFGFAGGAALPDPAGLLEGSGKVHRHVTIRSASDLDRPELHELIAAALARHR